MDLYYNAYGVQEILAHRIAELAGLYQEAGIEVTLKDGSVPKWPEVEGSALVSIGVGGRTVECLTRGVNRVVVCVNTQYPLFWLVSRPTVDRIAELKGARIAGTPLHTGPTTFLRLTFRRHGLDLLSDCSFVVMGDEERAEALQRGEVDAILVGRTPFALERSGFRLLAFIGTEVQAATVGLVVVNPQLIAPDHPDILRLVTATRNALARLHASRELAVQAIRDIERDISPEDAGLLYDRYIQPYWTHDGRPDRQIAERSLEELARELGVERAPAFSDLHKIP